MEQKTQSLPLLLFVIQVLTQTFAEQELYNKSDTKVGGLVDHWTFIIFSIDNRSKIKMMVGYSCNNMPNQNGRRDISNQINSSATWYSLLKKEFGGKNSTRNVKAFIHT